MAVRTMAQGDPPSNYWGSVPYQPIYTSSPTNIPIDYNPTYRYPVWDVKEVTLDLVKELSNTKINFDIIDGDPITRIVNAYTIRTEQIKEGEQKYAALTQELLESFELIYPDEFVPDLMHVGYLDCEVVGYVPLPHKIYLLRLIDEI